MEKINKEKYEKIYEQVLNNAIKGEEDNNIDKVLENISTNKHLSKKEKEKIYDEIFEYVDKVNKSFEEKIEEIYTKGIKDVFFVNSILDDLSKEELKKSDRKLELALEDYIDKRIETEVKMESNLEWVKNRKEIDKLLEENSKEGEKKIKKLQDLYEFNYGLENIEAYKIGFKDSMKILSPSFLLTIDDNIQTKNALKEDFRMMLDKCNAKQQSLIFEIAKLISKMKFEKQ